MGAVGLYTTPLVVIQVNIFACGGLVIVVRISHMLADAPTGLLFMNAWATANRVGVAEVIAPNFNLASVIPIRPGIVLTAPVSQKQSNSNIITKRFVFDKTAVSALKMKASELVEDADLGVRYTPTRVEVVSALIWRALINTARAKNGHLKPSLIVHSFNLRGKTDPPMDDNTCGNFYVLVPARFILDESNMELHDLVQIINNAMRRTNKMYSNAVLDGDEFFALVFNAFKDVMKDSLKPEEIDVRMFASWCGIPFYGVDFGWGKPSWISTGSRKMEMVSLQDTESGDGVEAWVCLKEKEMLRFEQDLDIVAYTRGFVGKL